MIRFEIKSIDLLRRVFRRLFKFNKQINFDVKSPTPVEPALEKCRSSLLQSSNRPYTLVMLWIPSQSNNTVQTLHRSVCTTGLLMAFRTEVK